MEVLFYVLIGYDFFGSRNNLCFDTAIPTSQLDSVIINSGVYDELYISLDTAIAKTNNRPKGWFLKNIMHAKFENDLESGNLDADGHKITKIQIYRRILGDGANDWVLVGEFEYKTDFNVYSFVDVTAESDRYYEYSIVPVAGEVILQINVVPFDKCNEDNTVFSVKILFEQPTSDFRYPDLTKREWQLYMKYYFKAFPTGDTLKLCYGIYRPGWKDKPLPELRFEVIAGGRISRTVETRETTAEYPCETFALPDDFKWVIVTEKAHGYKVSYDKNGKYRLLPS